MSNLHFIKARVQQFEAARLQQTHVRHRVDLSSLIDNGLEVETLNDELVSSQRVAFGRVLSPASFRVASSSAPLGSALLDKLIAQLERMLHAMSDRGTAIATEAKQFTSAGSRDNGIGLLRLAVFE